MGAKIAGFLAGIDIRRVTEQSFYIGFTLICLSGYIGRINFSDELYTLFDIALDAIRLVALASFFVSLVCASGRDRKHLFLAAGVIFLSAMTWVIGGSSHLFWLLLVVVSASRIDINKIAKIVFTISMGTLLIAFFLYFAGIIENAAEASTDYRPRMSLGFGHPNALGLVSLEVLLSYTVLHFGRMPIRESMLGTAVFFLSNYLADSRTYAVSTLLWIMLVWIAYFTTRRFKIAKLLSLTLLASTAVFFVSSICMMVFYNPDVSFFEQVDGALSGRLRLMHGYYSACPVSLFGADYTWLEPQLISRVLQSFVVDNGYCYIYLRFGIIGTVLLGALFIATIKRGASGEVPDVLLLGLLLFSIIGFVEGSMYQIVANFFLIAFSPFKNVVNGERAFASGRLENM